MVKEVSLLEAVSNRVKLDGKISEDEKNLLLKAFGKRFLTAVKAVEEGTVKKYVFDPSQRTVWIVVGKEKDYQVIPTSNYCSCDDFYFRVLRGDTSLCYHVIAQKLAEAMNKYELISDSDMLYEALMRDWRFIKSEDFSAM